MSITAAKLLIVVGADIAGAQAGLKKIEGTVLGLSNAAQNVGKVMSIAITAPLVLMARQSVMAASDLDESLNKIRVVFGQSSDGIVQWSETASTALGMSQQAALEATGTFGNLFVTMGLGEEAAGDMGMELVQLASDLASFNNLDPTVVLEKLRSGLVGEVEPLRVLGVNVQESAVQLKALEMGLAATTEELTNQDKVMARYTLIMEQTRTAQGDFARTSDGLANQMRTLKASITDASVEIGEVLAPYVQEAVTYALDLIKRFVELDDGTKRLIVTIGGLAAATGPALMIFGRLAPVILGAGQAMLTFGGNAVVAIQAWRAGLTLSTSLAAGFGSMAAALGPLAIAVGVAAAGWVIYNKTIGATTKEIEELQTKRWDQFFSTQVVSIDSATIALKAFTQAQRELNAEMDKRSGFDQFIGRDTEIFALVDASRKLGEVVSGLGGSYLEYGRAVAKARVEQGTLSQEIANSALYAYEAGGDINALTRWLGIMTEAEFNASKESQVLARYIAGMGGAGKIAAAGMEASNSQVEKFIRDAKLFVPAVKDATDAQKKWNEEMANTVLEAGLAAGVSGELQDIYSTYSDTMGALIEQQGELNTQLQTAYDIYGFNNQKLSEFNLGLYENKAAQEEATLAMQEATTQMIYQQAAAGLDAQSALTLARSMGVLSEQDYTVASSIETLKASWTGMDGIMDPTEAAGYALAVQNLNLAVQNLVAAGLPVTIANINTEMAKLTMPEDIIDIPTNMGLVWGSYSSQVTTEVSNMVSALGGQFDTMTADAKTSATSMASAYTTVDWAGVGTSINTGIATGIKNSQKVLEAAARAAAAAALAAAMAELGANSPSREFARVGQYAMEGMALGITENAVLPASASAAAARASVSAAQNTNYTTTYTNNVEVNAQVASEIDTYRLAQIIADEIRQGQL